MTLAAGTKLGPYEILCHLGAGGMGEGYRARDTKLNRDVALKVLPEAFARDPERMARFQREAQALPRWRRIAAFSTGVLALGAVLALFTLSQGSKTCCGASACPSEGPGSIASVQVPFLGLFQGLRRSRTFFALEAALAYLRSVAAVIFLALTNDIPVLYT